VKEYLIRSKEVRFLTVARDRMRAFRNFFLHLKKNPHLLEKIGVIAVTTEDGKIYLMRTIPTIYALGLIDRETALLNLRRVGFSILEADALLDWMVEEDIRNLELEKESKIYK